MSASATAPIAAGETSGLDGLELEPCPGRSFQRIKYKKGGYNFWDWKDSSGTHRIHYIQAGLHNTKKPTVLLVHGFGASAYHWRHNIPALVEAGYRVFAVDLLGFGWSDKAVTEYTEYAIWRRQLHDFMTTIVKDQCVLVGNSLGGYCSLAAAANNSQQVRGVALLNGAGRFDDLDESLAQQSQDVVELDAVGAPGQPVQRSPEDAMTAILPEDPSMWERLQAAPRQLAMRASLYVAFIFAKQPLRVKQVLDKVYIDRTSVDDDLVQSIVEPAQDPAAAEVFRLILSANGGTSINRLLKQSTDTALLLAWGELDPWIRPSSADKIMQLRADAVRVRISAGHCPHDEAPAAVNNALTSWLATLA